MRRLERVEERGPLAARDVTGREIGHDPVHDCDQVAAVRHIVVGECDADVRGLQRPAAGVIPGRVEPEKSEVGDVRAGFVAVGYGCDEPVRPSRATRSMFGVSASIERGEPAEFDEGLVGHPVAEEHDGLHAAPAWAPIAISMLSREPSGGRHPSDFRPVDREAHARHVADPAPVPAREPVLDGLESHGIGYEVRDRHHVDPVLGADVDRVDRLRRVIADVEERVDACTDLEVGLGLAAIPRISRTCGSARSFRMKSHETPWFERSATMFANRKTNERIPNKWQYTRIIASQASCRLPSTGIGTIGA